MITPRETSGFSLVEIAISLGVIAFAMVSMLALLPLGITSNRTSAEETQAVGILSLLEADLRNTHPSVPSGRSWIFGFDLPYAWDATASKYDFNSALESTASTLGDRRTTGLDEPQVPIAISAASRPRYQVSVIYGSVPPPGSTASLQARLVVNWPAIPGATAAQVTDPAKTSGFVESMVSFPAP